MLYIEALKCFSRHDRAVKKSSTVPSLKSIQMLKLFKHFAKLCFFSGDPADVDGRTSTLVVLFLILLVLDPLLPLIAVGISPIESFSNVRTVIDEVVGVLGTIFARLFVALCVYVILHVRRVPEKFRQTFSSYLGVSILIALFLFVLFHAIPLIASIQPLSEFLDGNVGNFRLFTGTLIVVLSFITFITIVWKILAFGFILYKSMEVKFWHAGIVAIMLIYAADGIEFLPIFDGLLQS